MVSKITSPVSPLDVITKINSIIDDKQDKLTSGTNIKTVNSTSLLGSGNVAVQATLVSGTNIKTINSTSLLGSGNISIPTLPSQSGNSGKYLTTNGSTASWAEVQTGGNRNIGEIVASSLPLTDAGLHLLDGSLIHGGGVYSEFVDYIADLYGDGTSIPSYFCTESEWQTSVTTYGVCGKFVYDLVNNTVRLPKVTGIVEGTTDLTALGDLVEAGLPDHNHNYTYPYRTQLAPYGGESRVCWEAQTTVTDATANASLSNSIYGNSSTVQPQTIKAFYYIVIANSTKTDIQVDIDEITTDLNGKADVDLSNMSASQSAKNEIIGWGMPDYANGITFTGTITLPCAALIWSGNDGNGSWVGCGFYVNNIFFYNSSIYTSSVCTIADKGTTVQAYEGTCIYYPLKGAN